MVSIFFKLKTDHLTMMELAVDNPEARLIIDIFLTDISEPLLGSSSFFCAS